MIIGLCGEQGAGKDTVGNILSNNHNYIKLSFSSILKDVLSVLFDWDRELLEGVSKESRKWREESDVWWSNRLGFNITPRKMMQKIGTNVFRNNFNINIWIYCVENKLRKYSDKNIVICDCRFKNEIEMIKKMGGYMVKIDRNLDKKVHLSEMEWRDIKYDYILDNSDSIKNLDRNILLMLDNFQRCKKL